MTKLLTVLLLAAAGAGWWFWGADEAPAAVKYRTQAVDRGDIVQTITANGTLSPLTTVHPAAAEVSRALSVPLRLHAADAALAGLLFV